jgi:RNA polymerase sigma factor (sigma-70 family)
LLARLEQDGGRPGEKYEDLRRTLTRFFEWRGAPQPDEQSDETLDRIAHKLNEGIEINQVGAYAYEVARFVLLESLKAAKRNPRDELDEIERTATVPPEFAEQKFEEELRLGCLDQCLDDLPPGDRELITEYYREEKRARIDHRKALADRLGLRRDALANRAQRIRDKLEQCVTRCVRKKTAI